MQVKIGLKMIELEIDLQKNVKPQSSPICKKNKNNNFRASL